MKVLYLIDSLEGYGAENSIVQIALHLEDVTPVFVHLFMGDKLKVILEERGIKVYSLNIISGNAFKEAQRLIKPIIISEKPAIIHSTLFRADMVARKLKIMFPHIFLVGSFVSNSYGINRYKQLSSLSKLKLFSTQLKDRMTSAKVDFFICNSNAIKKTNVRALGISEEKVEVIFRGRCFKDYNSNRESLIFLKEDLNLTKKNIFLNVSRLHKGKGQADLIKAFSYLCKQVPNSVLLISGEGTFRGELEELIKRLQMVNNVFLLGYREDIPDLLSIADYFVFPSYFEGLPGALIEAIISKTPTIVSNIPENMECLPKEGALFFESGNIQELSRKMEEALIMDNWQDKIEESYNYAKKNFDIAQVSLKYEKFYQKILSDSKLQIEKH